VEEEDLRGSAWPADADRLALARHELWAEMLQEGQTDPVLSLEDHARVSAALAEAAEPRSETLARFGLDEDRWSIEEQGWALRMASDAADSGGAMAMAFGERFVAEQDRLARPEEAEIGVDDYVAIRDAVEQAEDPSVALRAWALTLPMWMRLERRMMGASLADRAVAREIRTKLAALRAKRDGGS
jgi:hypothetical protein